MKIRLTLRPFSHIAARAAVGVVTAGAGFGFCTSAAKAGDTAKKPFPPATVVLLPDDQASFQVDRTERLRFHFGRQHVRPFWFPVIGPAGEPITRMTHPHDPHGHSHHKSVWVAHHDVNGMSFWGDRKGTQVVCERVEKLVDDTDTAAMIVQNHWLAPDRKLVVSEKRTTTFRPLPDGESVIEIDLTFAATEAAVTFGKTPFGFLGVRVAKMMGVHDGGGTIRNSEGGINEKEVFWKSARWVDYTGRVTPDTVNGITLMDHPSNPRHPTYFHVRDDGWMGTSFCLYEPYELKKGQTLTLRYGLYVHRACAADKIETQWKAFAARTK